MNATCLFVSLAKQPVQINNIRVMNNRGFNAAHHGLTAQPMFGGPVYFIGTGRGIRSKKTLINYRLIPREIKPFI